MLPELPEALLERGLSVEIAFVNQLSRSQQVDDVNNITQYFNLIAQLAQVKPEALDWIDVDGAVKHLARLMSVPEVAVANEDVVEQVRQARAQQIQAQQALNAGVQAADIKSKVGEDLDDLL